MDKKVALVTLLENSFWIADTAKITILNKLDSLSDDQIDQLGKLLAEEREIMIQNKNSIIQNSELLLDTIQNVIISEAK